MKICLIKRLPLLWAAGLIGIYAGFGSPSFFYGLGFLPGECQIQAKDEYLVNLLIKRKVRSEEEIYPGCILGELYVNGRFFCHTLERIFDDSEDVISSIPTGSYYAYIKFSESKRQWRIQLEPVMTYIYDADDPFMMKGRVIRSGIQVHPGTKTEHTRGCILVGRWSSEPCQLYQSHETFKRLLDEYFGGSVNPYQHIKITVTIRDDFNEF